MFIRGSFFIIIALALCSLTVFSQANSGAKPGSPKNVAPGPSQIKASAAYTELIVHKADIEAELVDLLVEYTEEYPKVKQLKLETGFLQAELYDLQKLDASMLPKLTESFAKLLLRKVQMEVELAELRATHKDDHPDVIRAKQRVEIYEKAIKDLLQ